MKFIQTETTVTDRGIKLNLPSITDDKLPTVSIVTITHNRADFIELMARNYNLINYPKEKLEWVIVDDSIEKIDYKSLEKLGARIIRLDKKLAIGHKRNFINCLTRHDYIVHMDDDDFYPTYSVISRIRTLLLHESNTGEPGCVGCNKVNCYDIITNKTFEAFDIGASDEPTTVSESTLAYSKKFWSSGHKFDNNDTMTECLKFIGDYAVCVLPSSFVITQFTHNTNTVVRRCSEYFVSKVSYFDYNFMDTLVAMDANIINNIKTKLILKMPDYKEAIEFVREILECQRSNPNNYEKLVYDKFEELEFMSQNSWDAKKREYAIRLLSNSLVINIRYEFLFMKKKSTGKDVVYYCGPGNILCHETKWCPESKMLGGSEEAVIMLSEYLVSKGYNVTVYNVLDGPIKKYNGVLYKNYWLWNPKDLQDITIIWRDYTIIKNIPILNSHKTYLDMHDAIELKNNLNYDKIFIKSDFHKVFCSNDIRTVTVPNSINPINSTQVQKENFALCTSSPDRCLHGLLKALPIIRTFDPDFTIHWAYGFSFGIKEGGLTKDPRPDVQNWYKEMISLMEQTEGFVNVGRLSQQEIEEYYKKAKYFIYGTKFPEIDCISLTKALSAECVPLVAGNGAVSEKLKKLGINFIETIGCDNSVIDTSLYTGPEFDDWINLIKTVTSASGIDSASTASTKRIKEIVDTEYSKDVLYKQWINN